jgi:pimeloyl-ACP methyl ester carboxylesterase
VTAQVTRRRRVVRTRHGSALLLVAIVLTACGGSARPKPVRAAGSPGWVVVADGHNVYFDCEGSGKPTVVFLSGLQVGSMSWQPLLNQISRQTRACIYDRYGLGGGGLLVGMPRRARDAHDQARELEQLLRNADIRAPYVLVGHSWGGALARLYAGTHTDVKALVLVDAASPGGDAAFGGPPLANAEHLVWEKSLNETGAVRSLGHMPLIVITAGGTVVGSPVWLKLQDRLAALSSQSVHVLSPSSGHFVQTDDPTLVEVAIRAAVRTALTGKQLPTCRQIFGPDAADRRCLRPTKR